MIFSYIMTAILIVISLVIQSDSFDVIKIAGVKPDILFIVIVYMSYIFGSLYGEVSGFIGGLLQDTISNSLLGMMAFSKMFIGFFAGMFGRNIIKNNILTIMLLLFVATIAKGIFLLLLHFIFHKADLSYIVSIIIPEAFYNAILAPPLFFIFDKIYENEIKKEV
jgi:rod shape-determining protein MreD